MGGRGHGRVAARLAHGSSKLGSHPLRRPVCERETDLAPDPATGAGGPGSDVPGRGAAPGHLHVAGQGRSPSERDPLQCGTIYRAGQGGRIYCSRPRAEDCGDVTATSQKTKRRTEQFDYEGYTLVTSASQVESFLTCPRKHWFRSSRRLPVLPSPAARLGELIHDRFEAWMTGTELDDLFPPFWGIEETPRVLAMVKHHVRAAIESQAITRIPGGRAEQPFQVDVGEGASLIGFLDLSAIYPDRVYYLDFKSKKNLKYA